MPTTGSWVASHASSPPSWLTDESHGSGAQRGHLGELCKAASFQHAQDTELSASVAYASFDEWWEPFTYGVGPAGSYVARLTPELQDALRDSCRALLSPGPFTLTAWAWAARGRAP